MSHSTLLQVDRLVKSYVGLRATDHASLSVLSGEIHALIGPNGAGKTTLIQLISGALAPDAGRIQFDGMDITRMALHQRVAHGLARSFQITSIFNRLSVLDNLALAVQAHAGHSMNFWR
ncbi:MAG: ABC transporter ATP-binding protein, partial [Comamonadaceae bacterium CG_4_9_14_3_um_filter_60_33]